MRVLLAGESWMSHTIHVKGFDSFTTSTYEEGAQWLIAALEQDGIDVDFIRNHEAATKFPTTLEALKAYDVVILSDIGANTLLLHPDTFTRSVAMPNRLDLIREFVAAGGGFCMVGGYMSFSGIDGKAKYNGTAIEEILPVTMMTGDDRVELPQGVFPQVVAAGPVLNGVPAAWPFLLGYNKTVAKPGAEVLVKVGEDPLVATVTYGKGRTLAFTSDCAPHWGPPEFVNWNGYKPFWSKAVRWLAGE